jgi:hypothetical protein
MRCSKDSSESVFERLLNVRWLVLADRLNKVLESASFGFGVSHMMMFANVPLFFTTSKKSLSAGTYLPLKHRFTRKAAWANRVKT